MNPSIQKLLDSLIASIDKIGAAAWDQAPLVFHDLITAGLISGIMWMSIGVVALVAWPLLWKRRRLYEPDDDGYFGVTFGASICAVAGSLAFVGGLHHTLTVWLAPRAYLLSILRG